MLRGPLGLWYLEGNPEDKRRKRAIRSKVLSTGEEMIPARNTTTAPAQDSVVTDGLLLSISKVFVQSTVIEILEVFSLCVVAENSDSPTDSIRAVASSHPHRTRHIHGNHLVVRDQQDINLQTIAVLDDFGRCFVNRTVNNLLTLEKKLLTVQRFWNNLNTIDFIWRQQAFIFQPRLLTRMLYFALIHSASRFIFCMK